MCRSRRNPTEPWNGEPEQVSRDPEDAGLESQSHIRDDVSRTSLRASVTPVDVLAAPGQNGPPATSSGSVGGSTSISAVVQTNPEREDASCSGYANMLARQEPNSQPDNRALGHESNGFPGGIEKDTIALKEWFGRILRSGRRGLDATSSYHKWLSR